MASSELEKCAIHLQTMLHRKLECNIFELEFMISSVSSPNHMPSLQHMPQILLYFISRVPSPLLTLLPKPVTWVFFLVTSLYCHTKFCWLCFLNASWVWPIFSIPTITAWVLTLISSCMNCCHGFCYWDKLFQTAIGSFPYLAQILEQIPIAFDLKYSVWNTKSCWLF